MHTDRRPQDNDWPCGLYSIACLNPCRYGFANLSSTPGLGTMWQNQPPPRLLVRSSQSCHWTFTSMIFHILQLWLKIAVAALPAGATRCSIPDLRPVASLTNAVRAVTRLSYDKLNRGVGLPTTLICLQLIRPVRSITIHITTWRC
jgi:hypothetical protein